MTQNNVNRSGTFFERVSHMFTMQRQYLALWLKLRIRRSQVPAGVLLSVVALSAVMVTIVTFDVVMLLASVFKKSFRRKKSTPFTSVRGNV